MTQRGNALGEESAEEELLHPEPNLWTASVCRSQAERRYPGQHRARGLEHRGQVKEGLSGLANLKNCAGVGRVGPAPSLFTSLGVRVGVCSAGTPHSIAGSESALLSRSGAASEAFLKVMLTLGLQNCVYPQTTD